MRLHGPHHPGRFLIATLPDQLACDSQRDPGLAPLQRAPVYPECSQPIEFQGDVQQNFAGVSDKALRHSSFVEIVDKHRRLDRCHEHPGQSRGPVASILVKRDGFGEPDRRCFPRNDQCAADGD